MNSESTHPIVKSVRLCNGIIIFKTIYLFNRQGKYILHNKSLRQISRMKCHERMVSMVKYQNNPDFFQMFDIIVVAYQTWCDNNIYMYPRALGTYYHISKYSVWLIVTCINSEGLRLIIDIIHKVVIFIFELEAFSFFLPFRILFIAGCVCQDCTFREGLCGWVSTGTALRWESTGNAVNSTAGMLCTCVM